MAFSVHQRDALWDRLTSEHFDVLVVGGGITGAGVARDAALRGLNVALVEMDDFASGTSSRSSKLIHGGLRYLEQGDVGLVFEAVRERQRLMKLAPHLAEPQSFVVPVYKRSKHSVLMMDLGLTIYDTLAAGSGVIRHRAMRSARLKEHEPLLRADTLRGGVRYFDAQTNDVRLVVANLRGAHTAGGVCVSRVKFEAPILTEGKVTGAKVQDMWGDRSGTVSASTLVLAAGPFADDAMNRWLGKKSPRPIIKPSKGVHIVLPRNRLPLSEAVLMTARDGRVVFALPWPQVSVIGTTDTPFTGNLSKPQCTVSDATYLLQCANDNLEARGGALVQDDIVSTWAGIRPLAIGTRDDEGKTYNTSREHVLRTDPAGMVMIAGGKLTTYRLMAAEALEAAMALLPNHRKDAALPGVTDSLPLHGAQELPDGRAPLQRLAEQLSEERGCKARLAEHLVHDYGSDAWAVLDRCDAVPDGYKQVISGSPIRWGEVDWVMAEEMPLDLVDLTVRRLPLYYTVGERLGAMADALADRMTKWAGFDEQRRSDLVSGLHDWFALSAVVPDGSDDAR
ncbi:MAG: glycerol-3-phosphate dehydrogenase/oxidase [Myxococcales bacterium]|nr:glycerol-3-phosphate dehydrogenase/oxidase [Myxococcales bacterium]